MNEHFKYAWALFSSLMPGKGVVNSCLGCIILFCIVLSCGSLSSPDNGHVTLTGTTVNSTATYGCNSSYVISGNNTRLCQSDGVWSGIEPTCSEFSLSFSLRVENTGLLTKSYWDLRLATSMTVTVYPVLQVAVKTNV